MSYASTASDLSNKEKYPLLFNMVPPDSAHNDARMAFLKYFKWKRIATIRQNDYVFDEVTYRPVMISRFPLSLLCYPLNSFYHKKLQVFKFSYFDSVTVRKNWPSRQGYTGNDFMNRKNNSRLEVVVWTLAH